MAQEKPNHNQNTEICCIGHITLDKIITPQFTAYMPGGTAYYFAKALKNLDHSRFKLVTSLGASEMNVVNELKREGIDVDVIPSRRSVYFENQYSENMNDRSQRVLAQADPFTIEKLTAFNSRIFHLGTLLSDDFSFDVIQYLSQKGIVSVDIQGYLRKVENEHVVAVDYTLKKEALPYISILKANEMEMEVLTGTTDPRRAAIILADWGCREVVLTLGDKGSLIYADGQFYDIPALPAYQLIDATGCGDTYMAGYLYKKSKGATYAEAGIFAAGMCSLKLGLKGPFSGTTEDIYRYISQYNALS